MFPVMPLVTSGSVSRYKLYAFYAIMFYNDESGKKRKKERNGLALHLHFSRDKTWWRRSAGENSFSQTKKGRGAEKLVSRAN